MQSNISGCQELKALLTHASRLLTRFVRSVDGVSAIEYGILVAGIALTAAVAFRGVGDSLKTTFDQVAQKNPVVSSNDSTGGDAGDEFGGQDDTGGSSGGNDASGGPGGDDTGDSSGGGDTGDSSSGNDTSGDSGSDIGGGSGGDTGGGSGGDVGGGSGGDTGGGSGGNKSAGSGSGGPSGGSSTGSGGDEAAGSSGGRGAGSGSNGGGSTSAGNSHANSGSDEIAGAGGSGASGDGAGGGSSGDSTGSSDVSTNDEVPPENDTGIGLIARADIPQVSSGEISTDAAGRGSPFHVSTAGDDADDTDVDSAPKPNARSADSSTDRKTFSWAWVLGVIAAAGVPLLYLIRRKADYSEETE